MPESKPICRFDPLLRSNDNSLTAAISVFAQQLLEGETKRGGRTRKRKVVDKTKFDLAVQCLVVNFVVARMRSKEAVIAVPLSNKILRGKPRYRPDVFGKHFRDIIYLMESLGLITIVTKGFNVREWNRSKSTTISPTTKLIGNFPGLKSPRRLANRLSRVEEVEVVVLKDRWGELADYKETKDTRRWRSEIQAINSFINTASVSIDRRAKLVDDNGFAILVMANSLRRIWNNSDWNQGGRLFGAVWQVTKREDRLDAICIESEPIANVDFNQFNLRLAYALAKAKPPRGDLYDITGQDNANRNWRRLREGRKKLVNAMFNYRKPLRRWPGKTAEERAVLAGCFPQGTSAQIAVNQIKHKHAAIAHYFESNKGLAFMRIESDILVASLLRLMKRGITALPIHDAVLVQKRFAHAAKKVLEEESKRRIGTMIPAEITTSNKRKPAAKLRVL